jgi:hypothetical protein
MLPPDAVFRCFATLRRSRRTGGGGVHWPDGNPELIRLPVLALLAGYDLAASRAAGAAVDVNQQPYSPADAALMDSASGVERHIARELRHCVQAADLYQLLRLGIGAPGRQQFLATLTTLAKPGLRTRVSDMTLHEHDQLRASQNAVVRAAFRGGILPHLTGPIRASAEAALSRIDAAAAAGPRPVRTNVVFLLLDRLPLVRQDVHYSGEPFTPAESRLVADATEKEWNEASNLLDADDEIEAARFGRSRRLHQILAAAPAAARHQFAAELEGRLPLPPDLRQSPLGDLIRYRDQYDAAYAAAFRRHILPDLNCDTRAEASDLLAHLDYRSP